MTGRRAHPERCDDELELIVGDTERADRSTETPHLVVLRPGLRVGFVGKERVVADDIAGDALDSFGDKLVDEGGEIGERWRLRWGGHTFRARCIREIVGTKVGVAAAEQRQVAGDGSGGGVELAEDPRVEGFVQPDECHRGGRGEDFVVGGWPEELALIVPIEGCAIERGDGDAPVRAGHRRVR